MSGIASRPPSKPAKTGGSERPAAAAAQRNARSRYFRRTADDLSEITACYPVHQAMTHGEDLVTGMQLCATRTRYPVHRPGKSGGEGATQARRHPRSKAPI